MDTSGHLDSLEFVELQRNTYNLLYLEFLSFNRIDKTETGKYFIRICSKFGLFLYLLGAINSTIKAVFLIGLFFEVFLPGEVDEDAIVSVYDWLLCLGELVVCGSCWFFRYPIFEVFYRIWILEERILNKLGTRRGEIDQNILKELKIVLGIDIGILVIGVFGAGYQFYSGPKFCLYTYALLEIDTWWLQIIFGLHEVAFVYQCWTFYASTFLLCSYTAISYKQILDQLTTVLQSLISNPNEAYLVSLQEFTLERSNFTTQANSDRSKDTPLTFTDPEQPSHINYNPRQSHSGRSSHSLSLHQHENQNINAKIYAERSLFSQKELDPLKKAPDSSYDIYGIIDDYKQLMMLARYFNEWVADKVGGQNVIGYAQMVSDVYMVFHILKRPEGTFGDVFYFLLDAIMGMYMTFRMMKSMAEVREAAESFQQTFKDYISYQRVIRAYIRKVHLTMHLIAFKIGPIDIKPGTVLCAMSTLLSYFICAAMW